MSIPKQSSLWDPRRNTSQVQPVPPDALPNAERALAHLHRTDPALCQWIADGYPTLTHAEHVERFGEPYKSYRKRKVVAEEHDTAA